MKFTHYFLSFCSFKYNFITSKGNLFRALAGGALLLGSAGTAQAQTTKPFACTNGKSYVLQGNATYAVELDVTTGNVTNTSSPITTSTGNVKFNAAGYNQKDNYIWALVTGSNQLVQVGSDYKANVYSVTGLSGEAVNAVVGDVDANGLLYLTRGGSTGGGATSNGTNALTIYTIDLTNPSSSNVYAATAFGTMPAKTSTTGIYVNDWAISPIDGHLYMIYATIAAANNASALTLYRILTKAVTVGTTTYAAGTVQTLGTVVPETASGATNLITASNYASSFMGSSGNY
ncbi:MAG: hypothetical protein ACRYFX_12320 [Janthinobacterium lividum]